MSEPFVSDRMAGTADCASQRPGFLSMLGAVAEVAEVEVKVESMKQNKRTIVRRRTQQLVYLELGRENGGVMLNLSEEGCGFQAITPVKCGESRFGFQINLSDLCNCAEQGEKTGTLKGTVRCAVHSI